MAAPVFDKATGVAATTGTITIPHSPVGTLRAVLVLVAQNAGVTDEVTGATYGGVAMTEVPLSPLIHSTGSEDGVLYGYFLGSGIPTGAQDCVVSVNATGSSKRGLVTGWTATRDCVVEDTSVLDSGGVANPEVTLTIRAITQAVLAAVLHSGQQAPGSITAGTNLTLDGGGADFGNQSAVWGHSASSFSADAGAGFTATIEEAGLLAVAIREAVFTVPVGLASETDAALAPTAAKRLALGLASEADTALPVTQGSAGQTIAVGLASEMDTALAMTAAHQAQLGLASSIEAALPITAAKRLTIGQAAETDAALPLTGAHRATLGIASETDLALPITETGAITEPVGLASETDVALPITAVKRLAVGQAISLESAFPVLPAKAGALGIASSTELALPVVSRKRVLVGVALEVDAALPLVITADQPTGATTGSLDPTATSGPLDPTTTSAALDPTGLRGDLAPSGTSGSLDPSSTTGDLD